MTGESHQLERTLAATLYWGTWVASSAVAVGMALALLDSRTLGETTIRRDMRITTVGIAMFVFLPIVRVMVMLLSFLRDRDYRFMVIAGLVLTITLLGLLVGLRAREVSWSRTTSFLRNVASLRANWTRALGGS